MSHLTIYFTMIKVKLQVLNIMFNYKIHLMIILLIFF